VKSESIAWYLCGLFLFALVVESAVTFAPGSETMQMVLTGTWAALAVLFAVAALTFQWLGVSRVTWLVRSLVCVAVVSTVVVLLLAVG
jgi:hypothetical protein